MDADHNPPYRATCLWNEVILAFRTGMPLKRHRHRIRHYSDCFTASDCISWLNCYLKSNPNFGPHVTRQQTIQLLQKFVKCHVIESAVSKSVKTDFRDNTHLYKFVDYSLPKVEEKSPLRSLLRTPLSSRNPNVPQHCNLKQSVPYSPLQVDGNLPKYESRKGTALKTDVELKNNIPKSQIPECHIVERRLAVTEIEDIWKTVTLNKLEKLLSPARIEDLVDLTKINGSVIRHNVSKMSKSGVVLLIDKTDDVPHWAISAMKCLANWPEASGSGSCLPNYPGFEKDVFKVVKDYFLNSQITLIPPHLQPLINAVISQFMKIDIVKRGMPTDSSSKHSCLSAVEMKNLNNQKTSTPLDKGFEIGEPDISDLPTNIQSVEGQLILNDSEAMWDNPLHTIYETEFYSASPVTRVVSSGSKESLLSLVSASSLSYHSLDTMSTLSACSRMTKYSKSCRHLDQSSDVMADLDKTLLSIDGSFKPSMESAVNTENVAKGFNISVEYAKQSFTSHDDMQKLLSLDKFHSKANSQQMKYSSCLANDSLNCYTKPSKPLVCERNPDNVHCKTPSLCDIFEPHQYDNIKTVLSTKIMESCAQTSNNTPSAFFNCNSSRNKEHQILFNGFKESLQYILLCLPISNRRQLHLLLRMINKILKNQKLVLDAKISIKDYLLETFLPAVMKFGDHSHVNMACAYEVFYYMVKECESLLRPPDTVKEEVQLRIRALQRQRIKYSGDETSLTYCQLISKQQYEEQKSSVSKQALFDLLETIIQNTRISEKEKKRKLKQFQMNHPDIYQERFSSHPELGNVKARKPLFTRILNLRM